MKRSSREYDFESAISDAVRLHGHLGPFLVLGVRMADLANRIFGEEADKLHVTMRLPLSIPFSCAIDGVQATTHCTVGNQRLEIENSEREISASFRVKDSNRIVHTCVRSDLIKRLLRRMSESVPNEKLARQVASLPAGCLFRLEKQGFGSRESD